MKTKKLLALLLAGAMSVSMLAGCGGGTDTAETRRHGFDCGNRHHRNRKRPGLCAG